MVKTNERRGVHSARPAGAQQLLGRWLDTFAALTAVLRPLAL
jgi:hypothetical protein